MATGSEKANGLTTPAMTSLFIQRFPMIGFDISMQPIVHSFLGRFEMGWVLGVA
jgi:hypothetical protein